MKRLLGMGLAAVAVLLTVSSSGATVFEVQIVDYQYIPPSITVTVGDSIHWTNDGAMPHTVTSGNNCTWDNDFDSGTLLTGQGWGYKTDAGDAGLTKNYFCQFHCSFPMVGSYTVQDESPTEATSWGKIKSLYK